jgi:signal peptidase I
VALPALGAAVIGGFVVKVYRVPSPSTEPTLQIGDHVAAITVSSPHVGDVVVFHPPAPP